MTASEQIIEVLNYICEKVGLAIDWTVVFANENVIPYIEQLCGKFVTYEIATSVVWMVVGAAIIPIGIWLLKTGKKINDGDLEYVCYLFGIILFIVSAVFILLQTFDIVTCVTFPEKILIEEITEIYNEINQ